MPEIRLPDGTVRQYDSAVTGETIAGDIGPGLLKAALAMKVNGELKDLYLEITEDCDLALITARDEEGVDLIRHDCAHIMAQAVQELYPDTQVTIGPVIEHGFFYDFAREESFTPEDLSKIESRMAEIVAQNIDIRREVWDRDDAIAYFKEKGEAYKAEIIGELPEGEEVSVYRQGDWLDLCRGPHLPSTGKLPKGSFKLTKLAGAYWRGNSDNEMLQRIYGTAWGDKKALKQHLAMIEEAERRDHRKLAKTMDLFHLQETAPGMVFWHPNGWSIYQALEQYMRQVQNKAGYKEIRTPQVVDRTLWEKSGHWEHYAENMFTTESEKRSYAVKPMNCPCHVQVFNQGLKSYKELPLRLAEFGSCHRNEPSGALHGIMRVRGFTQDDAHIFCTEEQIRKEASDFIQLTLDVYKNFGFDAVEMKLSTRPESRIGNDEQWDLAETALEDALNAAGLDWELQPGEGAFYGPKIEFSLRDCLGRVWQCGTLQLDFVLPGRLGAEYVDENSERKTPVMLHRAILGSFERFIGILIEHYAGKLPLWLAPQQVAIATIVSAADDFAKEVAEKCEAAGLKAQLDLRNEKINYKIRHHATAKVPVIFVIGGREAEEGNVTIRRLDTKAQQTMPIDEAIAMLQNEVAQRVPLPKDAN